MPNRTRYCFVKGAELLAILRASKPTPIKWLLGKPNEKSPIILPEMAFLIAKTSPYVGKINATGRVLYIKLIPQKPPARDDLYLDKRAVIRYHADQRNLPTKVKNRELVASWNRMLAMQPPPLSWKHP